MSPPWSKKDCCGSDKDDGPINDHSEWLSAEEIAGNRHTLVAKLRGNTRLSNTAKQRKVPGTGRGAAPDTVVVPHSAGVRE